MTQFQGWLLLAAAWIGLAHFSDGFFSWAAGLAGTVCLLGALKILVFKP